MNETKNIIYATRDGLKGLKVFKYKTKAQLLEAYAILTKAGWWCDCEWDESLPQITVNTVMGRLTL